MRCGCAAKWTLRGAFSVVAKLLLFLHESHRRSRDRRGNSQSKISGLMVEKPSDEPELDFILMESDRTLLSIQFERLSKWEIIKPRWGTMFGQSKRFNVAVPLREACGTLIIEWHAGKVDDDACRFALPPTVAHPAEFNVNYCGHEN